jgi:hypothetical protein
MGRNSENEDFWRTEAGGEGLIEGGKCTLLYNGLWKMNALGWELFRWADSGHVWGKSVYIPYRRVALCLSQLADFIPIFFQCNQN